MFSFVLVFPPVICCHRHSFVLKTGVLEIFIMHIIISGRTTRKHLEGEDRENDSDPEPAE